MPAIILDRDGVINFDSEEYIKSPAEWRPIPGSLEAIAALNRAGYCVYIATNQSGVARGLYDIDTLQAIHDKLHQALAKVGGKVTDIIYCPHHPQEACLCRKPKAGMLAAIQDKHQLDLTTTYFIGDSHVDIQAAQTIGCKPILVLTGNGEATLNRYRHLLANVPQFPDLACAVAFILTETSDE